MYVPQGNFPLPSSRRSSCLSELLRPRHELCLHVLEQQSGELVDQVTNPRGVLRKTTIHGVRVWEARGEATGWGQIGWK